MKQTWRLCLALLLLLSVLCLNVFSVSVNASEFSVAEQLGLSDEEFETLEEDGFVVFTPISFFANDSYLVEDNIQLSDGGIYVNYINANGTFNQVVPFGQLVVVGNIPQLLQFTLNNNGNPLFSKSGVLNLHISLLGTATLKLTRNGNETSYSLGSYSSITEIDYEIDNSYGDLEKVQLQFTDGVYVDGSGPYLRGGFLKYGYLLSSVPEEDTSKNIFELLKDFIGNFWNNIKNAFQNAIDTVITGLFVPDEDYLQTKTETLKEQVYDSLGLLIYPVAWLQTLFDEVVSADKTQAIFVFPEIKWDGYTVIPETSFDMYSFFYDNGFGFLIDVCRFATSVVLVGAFLVFCQDTLRRILDDN